MARLVIFDESVRGVDLPDRAVVLGRSRQADIPIHDKILSRKHCAIEPVDSASGSGWRLVDLESSNGTYLNGARIERSSLKFEDVIEIGNTVIILLDGSRAAAVRNRRAQLRNPVKARQLVDTLKGTPGPKPRPSRRMARRLEKDGGRQNLPADRRKMRAFEAVFAKWANSELLSRPGAQELIEGYVFHHIVSVAAKHSSELRGLLASILERALVSEAFSQDAQKLRDTIRDATAEALARHRASPKP